MPEPQNPANAAAAAKQISDPARAALVDLIHQENEPLQKALDDKLKLMREEIAKAELLANPEAQASLKRIVEYESQLSMLVLGKDGKGGIADRLADAEVLLDKLTADPKASDLGPDPRMEAFDLYKAEAVTNPILRDMLKVDPRLTQSYDRASASFLRHGTARLNADDRKALGHGYAFANQAIDLKAQDFEHLLQSQEALMALSTEFDPGAGIFVQPTMEARILRKVTEGSAILALAAAKTTTSDRHQFTIETGYLPTTTDVGEREARQTDDDEQSFWQKKAIDVHEEHVVIQITRAQIEDSGTDIVAELEMLASRSMLRRAAQKVVSGTGIKQAQGILSDSSVPVITTGTADTVPLYKLQQMHVDLLPEYLPNAAYVFSIGMLMSLILERDSINRPLWQPSLPDGSPSLFSGFRWYREPYMDRETAVSDSGVTFDLGAKPAIFGDIAQLYWWVNRRGVSVLRDEVTRPGFVKYIWHRRWGAGVALPDAGRILEVST